MLDSLRRFLGRITKPRGECDRQIQIAPDGFVVVQAGEPQYRVAWSAVQEISAYKQDRLTVDCIYLAFGLDGGTTVHVPEEMPGYEELVHAVERTFPDHKQSWWSAVAFPAFATNYTTIWKRGASPS